MDDAFSNAYIHADVFVEKVVNAQWYKKTNAQWKELCPNEPYLVLPVVGYIDKAVTNVNQRIELGPFLYTWPFESF